MTLQISDARRFSFASRPIPVPGDLRINWRLAVILMMLDSSRSKKASLAKLHLLNDAVRSPQSRTKLAEILSGARNLLSWRMRVEPAFGRAINFAVGENFAEWTRAAQRSGLQLTKQGIAAATSVAKMEGILVEEKTFFGDTAKQITEEFVTRILSGHRGR
jgi:hypothetical protein